MDTIHYLARIREASVSADSITVRLRDGRTIGVPLNWFWRLEDASPAHRQNFEIIGNGVGIHWPEIDENLSIEGILAGRRSSRPTHQTV